uniref:heparanase-like protein 3 n=1 Tax=Erigeron canadensis TaxID=72917 RepID=UPI001CB96DBF|nr:heparanase-like protein 3 [Erigeron canadensis]
MLMMGGMSWKMGICFLGMLIIFSCVFEKSSKVEKGIVYIDGESGIAEIDDDFICATMDWWPPEKCDYGSCSWDHASLLNVDLNNTIFKDAIKAFSPLKIRLGGSLQDELFYETENQTKPCIPFAYNASALFSFNSGCLPLSRWDELIEFFNETRAIVIFGLNALNGRKLLAGGTTTGTWDSTNAESFIRYTVGKNYTMYAWEFGNELCGTGVGTRVAASQYAIDTMTLKNVVEEIYEGIEPKPLIISPGGFFDAKWFKEYINKTTKIINVVSHHIYNLGAGVDKDLVEKILNPTVLDNEVDTFKQLKNIIETSETSASAWVGEAGGAYNSGHDLVTNAFVFSFWYLDQLGMSAVYNTKTYCRQTLIGGNYGLLNTTTFEPNPDYYSALLWHRLMGKVVLATTYTGTKRLRSYAHCAKESDGMTLLLINLDGTTTIKVTLNTLLHSLAQIQLVTHDSKMDGSRIREEYHLTAKDNNLHSQIMMLNGKELTVNASGNIPRLEPLNVSSLEPIVVAPYSIVFAHIPYLTLDACGDLTMEFQKS